LEGLQIITGSSEENWYAIFIWYDTDRMEKEWYSMDRVGNENN
jgi:hypothetical protein